MTHPVHISKYLKYTISVIDPSEKRNNILGGYSQRHFFMVRKVQLISKTNCQAMDSSKKRTNEFVFTSMRRVFVRFFEESLGLTICFRNYLTFNKIKEISCENAMVKNRKTKLQMNSTNVFKLHTTLNIKYLSIFKSTFACKLNLSCVKT